MTATYPTARQAFWQGVRDFMPLAAGMCAWALVTGVAMAKSGLLRDQAIGLGLIGFAGAAQLAALPSLVGGALVLPMVTALMVNLRFVIYSAGLAPHLRSMPFLQRLLACYLISDMAYGVFMSQGRPLFVSPYRGSYFLGVALTVGVLWHLACTAGILAAGAIPVQWGLEFAGTLALIALVVPMLASRPSLMGAATAALASLWLRGLPMRIGTVLAILAGIVVAVVTDARGRTA